MKLLTTHLGKIRGYFEATIPDALRSNVWRSCIHVSMEEVIGGRSNSQTAGITRQGFEGHSALKRIVLRHGGEFTQPSSMQMQGYFRTELDAYRCARSIQDTLRERRRWVPHHYLAGSIGLSSGVCLCKSEDSPGAYYGRSIGFASWLSGVDTGAEICASPTFFNRLGKVAHKLQENFIPASIVVTGYINPVSYYKITTPESEHGYQWESDQ